MSSRFGLEIRSANVGDAPGLAELLGSTAGGAAAIAERLEVLRSKHGTALLAAEWGPPSGIIVLHWYWTLTASAPTAQITTLLVAPDARRRGVGRALLKAASQSARQAGCGDLQLLAQALDPTLDGFCRATGFVEAGASFLRPLRKKG